MSAIASDELVEHGIQTYTAQLMVHVCPRAKYVYIYPTRSGVEAIESGVYRKVPGHQPGVSAATSMGYLVPPDDIEDCISVGLRACIWESIEFSKRDRPDEKGRKAVQLVLKGLEPILTFFGASAQEIVTPDLQIRGTDIIVKVGGRSLAIQVKCDFDGGPSRWDGTNYLFLQVAESNPFRYS